jgi:hypothetical protein
LQDLLLQAPLQGICQISTRALQVTGHRCGRFSARLWAR